MRASRARTEAERFAAAVRYQQRRRVVEYATCDYCGERYPVALFREPGACSTTHREMLRAVAP